MNPNIYEYLNLLISIVELRHFHCFSPIPIHHHSNPLRRTKTPDDRPPLEAFRVARKLGATNYTRWWRKINRIHRRWFTPRSAAKEGEESANLDEDCSKKKASTDRPPVVCGLGSGKTARCAWDGQLTPDPRMLPATSVFRLANVRWFGPNQTSKSRRLDWTDCTTNNQSIIRIWAMADRLTSRPVSKSVVGKCQLILRGLITQLIT